MRHADDIERATHRAHDAAARAVTGMSAHYPVGHAIDWHRHRRCQLLYAAQGVLRVETEGGSWLVPPTTAVWLRQDVAHRLVMHGRVAVHGVFIEARAAAPLPPADCVIPVTPLLRELIAQAARWAPDAAGSRRDELLAALLLEELAAGHALPVHLPWPDDPRIGAVCQALADDPADARGADAWAATLAMSAKTFHRHFLRGTGMTFGRWRQQQRLMFSLPALLNGAPVLQVALDSGYDSHSAYATAFRKCFGMPPSAFVRQTRLGPVAL